MTEKRYRIVARPRMMSQWVNMADETNSIRNAQTLARQLYMSGNYDAGVIDNDTDELVWTASGTVR